MGGTSTRQPVLLDTHVFVWALAAPDRLPPAAKRVLDDPSRDLGLSIASAWELAVKAAKGALSLSAPVDVFVAEGCARAGVRLVGLELAHTAEIARLPPLHRDPFDRMMVATARISGFEILSCDAVIDLYDVARAR